MRKDEKGLTTVQTPGGPQAGALGRATEDELRDLKAKAAAFQARPTAATFDAAWDALWSLIHQVAEREAALLLPAAEAVGEHHAAIGGAEILASMMTGEHHAGHFVDLGTWNRMRIPGSQKLTTLKNKGRLVSPVFHSHDLAGGEEPRIPYRVCNDQAVVMREALEDLVGFDMVAGLRRWRMQPLKAAAGGRHG